MIRHPISILLVVIFTVGIFCRQSQADMVYLYQKGEKRRVALANNEGELIRLLTPENLQAYHPEISADGRYVAYSIGTIQPEKVDVAIHVLDLETEAVAVWTPSGDQYIHAEFSGDGEYLAYSAPVEKEDGRVRQLIHLIHLPAARAQGPVRTEKKNGRSVAYYAPETEVLAGDHDMYFPALASDASFVVYHRSRDLAAGDTAKALVRYDRIQPSETVLTAEGGHAAAPSLSWDNRHLAYAGLRDGQWDIHLLDLRQGRDRRITQSPAKEFTPVFAPDGSITYTHITEGDRLWQKMTPLPFATFAPGAGIYRGKLFLFGGMNPNRRYQNTIYTLDMRGSRAWRNSGRYLAESKGFPIVVDHPAGGLGILGGHSRRRIQGELVDAPVGTFEHLLARDGKR